MKEYKRPIVLKVKSTHESNKKCYGGGTGADSGCGMCKVFK